MSTDRRLTSERTACSRRSVLGALGFELTVGLTPRSPAGNQDRGASRKSTALRSSAFRGTGNSATQEKSGHWSLASPLPVAQSDAGSAVLDGAFYLFGGIRSGSGLDAVQQAFRYAPTSEKEADWMAIDPLPARLWAPCGVAGQSKVFSFGGAPPHSPYQTGKAPSDVIFVYTPGGGWRNLTATTGVRCPYPTWAMQAVYDSETNLIYCVGGGTNVTDRESATDHGVGQRAPGTFDESRIWTFDPVAKEVANPDLARLPTAKRWPTVALLRAPRTGERYLHVLGGLHGVTGPTATHARYGLTTGEWEERTPIPHAGFYATTSNPVIHNQLYLTHGLFWTGRPNVEDHARVCHRYDPRSDTYVTNLAQPRYRRIGAATGISDGRLHVVGGHVKRYDQDGFHSCVPYHEVFTPSPSA